LQQGSPYAIDYARHPAYSPFPRFDSRYDAPVSDAVDRINALLLELEGLLTLRQVTFGEAIARANGPIRLLLDTIADANRSANADFPVFAHHLYLEMMRVVVSDLGYFARRNSYQPVIHDERELARRNALALDGFALFQLRDEELARLRTLCEPFFERIEVNFGSGLRGRDDLSLNQITEEVFDAVHQVFASRGWEKAVADVRHEACRSGGSAIELSVDDSDWWHSPYQDVGLPAKGQAAYFHNDESRDVYKAIIYLDDVGPELGPFEFVPSSFALERPRFEWVAARANLTVIQHAAVSALLPDLGDKRFSQRSQTSLGWRRLFALLPARLQRNSHFGFDVVDDSELARHLAAEARTMLGPAGSAVVFDGSRLCHRGGLVRRGRRRALQVIFEVARRNADSAYEELRKTVAARTS
jgi:hypothetical protein